MVLYRGRGLGGYGVWDRGKGACEEGLGTVSTLGRLGRDGEEGAEVLRAVPFPEGEGQTPRTTWVHAIATFRGVVPADQSLSIQRGNLIGSDLDIALHRGQLKDRPLGYFWRPPPRPLPLLRCRVNLGPFSFGGCLSVRLSGVFFFLAWRWRFGLNWEKCHLMSLPQHRPHQGKRLGVLSRDGEPFFGVGDRVEGCAAERAWR